MTIFHKIVKGGADIFKSLKTDNKKQLIELEKLEKRIEEMQWREKKSGGIVLDQRSFFKFWITGVLILFLAYIAFQSLEVIYLILAAYILSLAVEAIIDFFEKRMHSRAFSIVLAYLFVIILIIGWLLFIIPFFLGQVSDAITVLTWNISNIKHLLETNSLSTLVNNANRLPDWFKELMSRALWNPTVGTDIQSRFQENINQLVNIGSTYAKDIGNMAVNIFGWLVNFIKELGIVLTLAVLFSAQKDSVMKFIANLWWEKDYKYIFMRLERIYKKLGIRLKSQLLLCFFVGAMMLLSLWILSLFGIDLPNKFSLAFIVFLTELIPYFGPLLWWSVAALVAFIHFGWYGALIVIAIVFVINRLENNIFIPLLMNKTLWVNPVVIFISMILGWLVIGFVWVLLAVPISVIATLLIDKDFED